MNFTFFYFISQAIVSRNFILSSETVLLQFFSISILGMSWFGKFLKLSSSRLLNRMSFLGRCSHSKPQLFSMQYNLFCLHILCSKLSTHPLLNKFHCFLYHAYVNKTLKALCCIMCLNTHFVTCLSKQRLCFFYNDLITYYVF